jgi:hypothetical protein
LLVMPDCHSPNLISRFYEAHARPNAMPTISTRRTTPCHSGYILARVKGFLVRTNSS